MLTEPIKHKEKSCENKVGPNYIKLALCRSSEYTHWLLIFPYCFHWLVKWIKINGRSTKITKFVLLTKIIVYLLMVFCHTDSLAAALSLWISQTTKQLESSSSENYLQGDLWLIYTEGLNALAKGPLVKKNEKKMNWGPLLTLIPPTLFTLRMYPVSTDNALCRLNTVMAASLYFAQSARNQPQQYQFK